MSGGWGDVLDEINGWRRGEPVYAMGSEQPVALICDEHGWCDSQESHDATLRREVVVSSLAMDMSVKEDAERAFRWNHASLSSPRRRASRRRTK